MNRTRLSLLLVAVFSSCIDLQVLAGFECDDAGTCRVVKDAGAGGGSGGDGGSTGGGSTTGGGSATGGGAGGGTGFSNGSGCSNAAACASGFCVDNVCCDSACAGACDSCNAVGWAGTCKARDEGTTGTCGNYVCDGVSVECPASCTQAANCASGFACVNNLCVALKPLGGACVSSAECLSTFCADGVCCDGRCDKNCDRCNAAGACGLATAGTSGAPACVVDGGTLACNGVVADCPISCTGGSSTCPESLYCAGSGFCSSKKTNGAQCSAAIECTSGLCVDGVCCNSACGGDCQACSIAAGASVDGECRVLGTTTTCRGAVGPCDRVEKCDGVSPVCPANTVLDAGVVCATSQDAGCGACVSGVECSTTGTRSCTRNDYACNGSSVTCSATPVQTNPSCTLASTEGDACGTGAPTFEYGPCGNFANVCTIDGTQSRQRRDPVCHSSVCSFNLTNDSVSCTRSPQTGTSCRDAGVVTSACTRPANNPICSLTGTRVVTTTTYACGASNTCDGTSSDVSEGCNAGAQTDVSCGATVPGAWSNCTYADVTCSTTGSRTREVRSYACNASGACVETITTETDTAGCARITNGTVCRAATSACDVAETCSNGACPTADGVAAAGVECLPADEWTCTRAATCNGSTKVCPAPTSACSGTQVCCDDGTGGVPYCIKASLCFL